MLYYEIGKKVVFVRYFIKVTLLIEFQMISLERQLEVTIFSIFAIDLRHIALNHTICFFYLNEWGTYHSKTELNHLSDAISITRFTDKVDNKSQIKWAQSSIQSFFQNDFELVRFT